MEHRADRIQDYGTIHFCVQCDSRDLDSGGVCRVCGYLNPPQRPAEGDPAESRHLGPIPIETDVSEAGIPADRAEMPEWRQELSRRLQVIKQKREADSGRQDQDGAVPGATEKPERSAVEGSPSSPPSAPPGRQSPGSPGRAETLPDPQSHAHQDPVAETGPAGVPAMRNPKEEGDRTAEDIRSLIDKLVRKQDHPVENPQPEGVPAPTFHDLAIGADPLSDKLVLLTRTFSGLVDMVIVVLLAAAMIFVVDVIEGIVVFDGTSMIYYLALLVATFLIYSVFFLATANQTIGMMITDLRIVGPGSGRPDLRQIFVRCSSYLVSLFGAGIGLFWGVFDRESRCLHDRISRTRVIRLFPH